MTNYDLKSLRHKIDLIDSEIIELLNQRMELAVRSRRLKPNINDPEREGQVLAGIRRASRHLIRPEFSESLYRQIFNESKAVQGQELMLIGFQGEHGAYSEVASHTYDASFVPVSCREFQEVFEEVATGQLDYGIVPVENSLEGAVTQVNDLLTATELKIIGEIVIPIHHSLMALPETEYRDLKVVYSHPQALAQCRDFISRHKLEPRPFYDTAGAAKMLSENRLEGASVIANSLCADLYHLDVIKENIEDHQSNSTRFVLLSRQSSPEPGDKCSIIFATKDEAGALFAVLKLFYETGINLTRIESRPTRNSLGSYNFFLDLEGSDQDKKVADTLEEVQKHTISFKFLGCYKAYKGEAI